MDYEDFEPDDEEYYDLGCQIQYAKMFNRGDEYEIQAYYAAADRSVRDRRLYA